MRYASGRGKGHRRPHTTNPDIRNRTPGVAGGTCKMKRCAVSAPSMMVASSADPILLVFGTMISTAPVSSRMPVTYRSHCPKPTAVKSAIISGFPISFADEHERRGMLGRTTTECRVGALWRHRGWLQCCLTYDYLRRSCQYGVCQPHRVRDQAK